MTTCVYLCSINQLSSFTLQLSPYQGAFLLPMKKRSYHHDPYSSASIDIERNREIQPQQQLNERIDGLRFCECCKQRKPTNSRPHRKGWNCTDCIKTNKENNQ